MSSPNYVFQGSQHDAERIRLSIIQDEFDPDSCRRLTQTGIQAGWLALEWALVGLMWYVWFIVTIFRMFLGIGRGVWGVARWLLWL